MIDSEEGKYFNLALMQSVKDIGGVINTDGLKELASMDAGQCGETPYEKLLLSLPLQFQLVDVALDHGQHALLWVDIHALGALAVSMGDF